MIIMIIVIIITAIIIIIIIIIITGTIMTADNKYLYFIWKKLKHFNNVTHICYSTFIHNSLPFLKIKVIGRRYSISLWQSRIENYQEMREA